MNVFERQPGWFARARTLSPICRKGVAALAMAVASVNAVPVRAGGFPDPASVHMEGTVTIVAGFPWASVDLYRCFTKEDFIECDFVLTSLQNGAIDFRYDPTHLGMKLVDNFHVDHPVIRSRLLNGREQPQETITLSKGERTWFVQEFSGAGPDISNANVVFLLNRNSIATSVEHPLSDTGPTKPQK